MRCADYLVLAELDNEIDIVGVLKAPVEAHDGAMLHRAMDIDLGEQLLLVLGFAQGRL